ncbi:MAG: aconitate hydratase, partial [Proteobacteria bacterium]
ATATDLVLTVTQLLRKRGVVGKFVEYFGEGVSNLSIADRATLSNMSPEYGATVGIFPVDQRTIDYLRATGRPERAARAESYFKAQGLWETNRAAIRYSDTLELDLAKVEPCMAGPSRPQDRVLLKDVRGAFRSFLLQRHAESLKTFDHQKLEQWQEMSESMKGIACETSDFHPNKELGPLDATYPVVLEDGTKFNLVQGSIVMAAITSCTNTSNPQLMLGAALLARNAVRRGLQRKPWVKTTFAPGSLAVRDYIEASGLMGDLDTLGFNIAGFGCAVCIGNSGPLPESIQEAIDKAGIATASVLSGNRNFEARIHPSVMTNWLASPPLVVAAALAGNINVNLATDPIAIDQRGAPVFLSEIWPDPHEVDELVEKYVTRARFEKVYANVFDGDKNWQETEVPGGAGYAWDEDSTYIRRPPGTSVSCQFLSPSNT